jgi:hypothetical protein
MVVLSGMELLKIVRFEGSGSTRHSPVVKLTASMGDRYELLVMFFMVETADPTWLLRRPAVCICIGDCIELESSKTTIALRFSTSSVKFCLCILNASAAEEINEVQVKGERTHEWFNADCSCRALRSALCLARLHFR